MSVFKSKEQTPLETRVAELEKRMKELEVLVGKKPNKSGETKTVTLDEDEDYCVIS